MYLVHLIRFLLVVWGDVLVLLGLLGSSWLLLRCSCLVLANSVDALGQSVAALEAPLGRPGPSEFIPMNAIQRMQCYQLLGMQFTSLDLASIWIGKPFGRKHASLTRLRRLGDFGGSWGVLGASWEL